MCLGQAVVIFWLTAGLGVNNFFMKVFCMTNSHYQGQTGPKSIAGKRRSSMNALKTGMYAKSKVLPFEDAHAYARHVKVIMKSLAPEDALQTDYAQQIADSLWRGTRQELRTHLHREAIFDGLTPQMLVGLMAVDEERCEHAPDFVLNPNHKFSKKELERAKFAYDQYVHCQKNAQGVANYNTVWRTYPQLFEQLANWLKSRVQTPLFLSNHQGLNLAWQQNPKKIEKYLDQMGQYLWYVVNWQSLREEARTMMASWYFLKARNTTQIDQLESLILKERRVCQGLLETYFKLRKSQLDHVLWHYTQGEVGVPESLSGQRGLAIQATEVIKAKAAKA